MSSKGKVMTHGVVTHSTKRWFGHMKKIPENEYEYEYGEWVSLCK